MSDDYPPPDYDSIEQALWKEWCEQVQHEAGSGGPGLGYGTPPTARLLKRIRTFVFRFAYSEDEVLHKIRSDKMFAANFTKEPRRTGIHENIAAKWLERLPWVSDFEVLPKSGKNSLKVTSDGNIVFDVPGMNYPGKTLDFRWNTDNTTFYAMHKYTKEGGGNQDSQYQEMVELMQRFMRCRDSQIALMVIVDGPYYRENEARRLRELQSHQRIQPPMSYALPIGDVPDILERHC